jgi:hypothetical protein
MVTIFYLCGFFILWVVGVAIMEWMDRRRGDVLPPPDRSTRRSAEYFDQQDKYAKRLEKQS